MRARKISVAIIDADTANLAEASRAVQSDADLALVGTADSRESAERLLAAGTGLDVLVIDPDLGEGIADAAVLRHAGRLGCEILAVSALSDERSVVAAIEAGASGYILKMDGFGRAALPDCIKLLAGGGSPVSPLIARIVLRSIRNRSGHGMEDGDPRAGQEANPLSARETEILRLLAKGMSFNKIGEILSVSPHTVTAHIKKIYRKLQVHSRGEAVYEAAQMGILPR